MTRPLVTLTTDFGTRDSYVGVMKGVILSLCPTAQIVDITHEVPPQDIQAATAVIDSAIPYFPAGAVHVVVVDPGVGSDRQPIALETPLARFVGPDNGLFYPTWQQALARWSPLEVRAVALSNPRFWRPEVSATFHGRDIFAPVAAHLALGATLTDLGTLIDGLTPVAVCAPTRGAGGELQGLIRSVDHFGNCITNIGANHLEQLGAMSELVVDVAGRKLPIHTTYADVDPGAPLALLGSNGLLEIAVRNGNAQHSLGIGPNDPVVVRPKAAAGGKDLDNRKPACRVLIADDDAAICRSLQAVLEMEGYAVETVSSGALALARLGPQYDILITDLSMPDIDGLALIRRCREQGLDLTVIIMTAFASLETAVQALQLGAYDYVFKPFEPPLLLAAVARAAERQRMRRQIEQRQQLEMVSRLAFTVRHEINNPLAAIVGLAQLHLAESIPDELRRDLETIALSASRISDALQRLTHLRQIALTDTGLGDGSTMLMLDQE